jgi:hypothetical protein
LQITTVSLRQQQSDKSAGSKLSMQQKSAMLRSRPAPDTVAHQFSDMPRPTILPLVAAPERCKAPEFKMMRAPLRPVLPSGGRVL